MKTIFKIILHLLFIYILMTMVLYINMVHDLDIILRFIFEYGIDTIPSDIKEMIINIMLDFTKDKFIEKNIDNVHFMNKSIALLKEYYEYNYIYFTNDYIMYIYKLYNYVGADRLDIILVKLSVYYCLSLIVILIYYLVPKKRY